MRGIILVGLVSAAGAAGCVRHVGESDVFMPSAAAGTVLTVSDDNGVVIDENGPAPGLWDKLGVDFVYGNVGSDVGQIRYRLARTSQNDGPLIVYCGGNTYDVEHHGDVTTWRIVSHGDALVWDYPGYGDSEGEATVADFRAAIGAFAETLPTLRRSKDQPIIFWGHSLGGFVCSELAAAAQRADGIVFEASAPSAEAASRYLATPLLRPFVRVRLDQAILSLDNVAALEDLRLPVLVLAAKKDRVLPSVLSRDLRDLLADAGHTVTYHEFREADHLNIGFQPDHDAIVSAFFAR